MNVLILHTQVPFTTGGAEVLTDGLRSAIAQRGHSVDIVALPLNWNPTEGLLTSALAWRMLDLTTFNGRRVDLVICTKYPTWAVRHPHKVLWLVHQHRQVYDWYGTPLSEFTPGAASVEIRRRVIEIDKIGIGECKARFAISRNVSRRLRTYCGIDAEPLYPPVPREGLCPESYEPFVVCVSRLDRAKRVDALVRAWRHVDSSLKLVIAGDGPEQDTLEQLVSATGQSGRVRLLGRVEDDCLRSLYNTCRAVYYAPVDEDYGYAAIEALAAGKPVVTAPDSGGVLEFVLDGENGFVTELEQVSLATVISRLADERLARELGSGGPERVSSITWETVVDSLLQD